MGLKNQRGQIIAEFVLTIVLFTALATAIMTLSKNQRAMSDQYKISKSVKGNR